MSKFYYTYHLTFEQKRDILLKAKEDCRHWWADILDCSKSFCRQKVDLTFEEIMQKFDKKSLFTVIHRDREEENYIEVGFRTLGGDSDYFLWIILDLEKFSEENYGLEVKS